MTRASVQPEWCRALSIQQQSVLFLAARGPDGVRKQHPCKAVVRAYRACVLKAASRRRLIRPDEPGDSFMDARPLAPGRADVWYQEVQRYFDSVDELPHHYHLHLLHGAQILGDHHPDEHLRTLWGQFYMLGCADMHMTPETKEDMDFRLNDFGTFGGGEA